MKTTLSFSMIAAAAALLTGCSDDGDDDGGAGGTLAGASGAGAAPAAGTGGTMTAGSAGTGAGGTGADPALNLGAPLVIDGDTIVDANGDTGIDGGAFPVFSPLGSSITFPGDGVGEFCISGDVGAVQLDAEGNFDYGNYWGVELDVDLLRVPVVEDAEDALPTDAGAPAADASLPVDSDSGAGAAGDAGGGEEPGLEAAPWDPAPGNVIGFQFTVTGEIPVAFRFKSTATGNDPAIDNFCAQISPISGEPQTVLFDNIYRDCWNGPSNDTLSQFDTLQNLGFQIPASEILDYTYDFCISDITPVLSE